jgi:hypothetical protein
MTTHIDDNFDDGNLTGWSLTTGTGCAIAHSTDIDHGKNPSGNIGSAKFTFGGSNGQAYMENTSAFGMSFDRDLWIRFFVFFSPFRTTNGKKNAFGGGADIKFFDLRDGSTSMFSIYMQPDRDSVTRPQNQYSLRGRWELITTFNFGAASGALIEEDTWHLFWVHYRRHSSTGKIEWGIDAQMLGESIDMDTDTNPADTPDKIRIGPQSSNQGRPTSSSVMYVDDVLVTSGDGADASEIDEETLTLMPYWQAIGGR